MQVVDRPLSVDIGLPGRETRIRTLGWDGLDVSVEDLIAAIAEALAKLNHTYDIDHKSATVFLPGNEQRMRGDENDLMVHFLVQRSEGGLLNLDIRRLRGDSFRFHALYREFRQAMSAINGWDKIAGEYRVALRRRNSPYEEPMDGKSSPSDASAHAFRALRAGSAPTARSPMGARVGSVPAKLDACCESEFVSR